MTPADRTQSALRRRSFLGMALFGAVALATLGGPALAYADPVDLQIVDRETGQVLKTWSRDGRLYVAGRPGARYGLRVTNNTEGRVLVVLSVDGVNILSGETAGYDQRGYIFSPHESDDLTGWRKSLTEVAAFTFSPQSKSYATRTGRPADVGVIGMAVFKERAAPVVSAPPTNRSYRDNESAGAGRGGAGADRQRALPAPPPSAMVERLAPPPAPQSAPRSAQDFAAQPRQEKLGTAHGALEHSVTSIEAFERATSYPQFTRQIEYDTYANLAAAGVIPTPRPAAPPRPRPFPAQGFVPDPPR